jgi:hypothetical protein
MKKIIGIAVVIAATALASPANAQSFDPDNGTGNIVAAGATAKRFETRTIPDYLGADAYAMSARRKAGFVGAGWGDANTTTGGGSPGHNEMLRNW